MLFARALAARSLDGEMTVESAGTSDRGQQVPAELLEILDERGVDLSSHRGRELGASMLLQADLVIALDQSQVRAVVALDPLVWAKTFRIGEFVARGRLTSRREADQGVRSWIDQVHRGRSSTELQATTAGDDISDPIGGSRARYVAMVDEVAGLVNEMVDLLYPA